MKCVYLSVLIFFVLSFFSCQKEFDSSMMVECQQDIPVVMEKDSLDVFSLHIIYNNKDYYSQARSENDSLIIFDQSLLNLIDSLWENNSEMQTLVHEDGSIEYFENSQKLDAKYKFTKVQLSQKSDQKNTYSFDDDYSKNYDGHAHLWQHPDYKGWDSYPIYANYGGIPLEIGDMAADNDEISSIEVYNTYKGSVLGVGAVLECYADKYFDGGSLVVACFARNYVHRISNLREIPYGRRHWDNRISSYRFYMATSMPK